MHEKLIFDFNEDDIEVQHYNTIIPIIEKVENIIATDNQIFINKNDKDEK